MKIVSITSPLAIAAALTLVLPALVAQDKTTVQASASTGASISPDVPQHIVQIKQWRGQYGGEEKTSTQVFTTADSWAKLWKHLGAPPHDVMDENTQMGVCISIGERPTSGYKPYIISAVERDGKLVVTYSTGQPALNEMVAQDITHPWVAALIPRSALPVVFKEI